MAEKVTVKSGETLSSIAKTNNTTVTAILAANPVLTSNTKYQGGNVVFSGTKLNIPTSSTIQSTSPYNTTGPFNPQGGVGTDTYGPSSTSSTPSTTTSQFPVAGTVISSSSVPNGDGTFTVTTIYADGKGGTYQTVTQSGVKKEDDKATRDAFAIIKSTLKTYGFTEAEIAELNTFIEAGLTDGKMGPEQLKLQLRELPTYKARFAGNTTRVSAGLNALSESDYLQQENDYSQIFKMYGVGNLSSRSQFSSLIGNNISVTEATKRVDAAVKRVKNGDPAVLTTLRTLYPNITDTDIVSYFLKPEEMLPELERKTTVAEIGATAGQFGMKETGLANLSRFEDLQKYGVTLASARTGYGTIAEELPGATKLGNVYGETGITYGQTEAEAEQFKNSADAKRKKEKLIETEKSSFKGSAGLNTGGLSTQYLRRSSSAGQF